MMKTAWGDAPVTARTVLDGQTGPAPRDVAELVRRCSGLGGRQGFRVVARGLSGHVFFERGRVIHAEFGEDCGLRAVVEMLRAGSVRLEPAATWPTQPSLHLGPELLLSMTARDASRVVRKVDLPIEPPPLPQPGEASAELEGPVDVAPPYHPGAVSPQAAPHRPFFPPPAPPPPSLPEPAESPSGRRAVSGVMPRLPEPPGRVGATLRGPARAPDTRGARGPRVTKARVPQVDAAAPASSTRPVEPSARAPGLAEPRSAPASAAVPAELPLTRAERARSRSVIVARSKVPPARDAAGILAMPRTPIPAPRGSQPTTMVRIASRGELLAAHGENAEQLAEAAAFIHGLANLIAADFGRQGRANVHLSGRGVSLLVARSEVNDIAAALGPTERMSSLLGKVGLK